MATQHIIVSCDLHDKNMLTFIAADQHKPHNRTFANTEAGRKKMIAHLKQFVPAIIAARSPHQHIRCFTVPARSGSVA